MEHSKYKNLSSPRLPVRRGLGNLPLSESLLKEEKQPYLIKQAEDPQTLRAAKHSGMTDLFYNGNNGFTLIELLVVVLIIGILAAVALPQYRLAVAKARLANLISMGNAVLQAEESYYLANNTYTEDWDALPLSLSGTVTGNKISATEGWEIRIENSTSDHGGRVKFSDSRVSDVSINFFYQHDTTFWKGKRLCYAKKNNTLANALCKNATNRTSPNQDSGDWNYYYF